MLLLIPLAIPAGLFAPNFIAVMSTGDPYPGLDTAPDAPSVELDHVPLRYPRHFEQGQAPPQTHTAKLARLFRPAPPPEEPVLPEPPPPSPVITISEIGSVPSGFDVYPESDPIEVVELSDSGEDHVYEEWPTAVFIAGLPTGDTYTQPPAVPEPGTGVLLGAGLIALAARRRSLRRAS